MHRLLLADDSRIWCDHLRVALESSERWQVVAEAWDGPEAIQKAREIRPDVVLLDVCLPSMSGIEVARMILAEDPAARILFVSEHRCWEVVERALATGAHGFIVKSDAGRELFSAIDAVIAGERFVSLSVARGHAANRDEDARC